MISYYSSNATINVALKGNLIFLQENIGPQRSEVTGNISSAHDVSSCKDAFFVELRGSKDYVNFNGSGIGMKTGQCPPALSRLSFFPSSDRSSFQELNEAVPSQVGNGRRIKRGISDQEGPDRVMRNEVPALLPEVAEEVPVRKVQVDLEKQDCSRNGNCSLQNPVNESHTKSPPSCPLNVPAAIGTAFVMHEMSSFISSSSRQIQSMHQSYRREATDRVVCRK